MISNIRIAPPNMESPKSTKTESKIEPNSQTETQDDWKEILGRRNRTNRQEEDEKSVYLGQINSRVKKILGIEIEKLQIIKVEITEIDLLRQRQCLSPARKRVSLILTC